ncbi:MAG TPA: acyl-CoA dehydrogenase family protein [Nocardioides sp.]|uniref:acyl-CoA dehydrogenase family protein n=1 Tax=Nocardioides sp. TaxID=35761 RepID=UPI002E3345FF|nr:acyl-CoA dehydrogenase family protein [Nocardioides sp.]HEX5088140.1 acyl-CoA dehydrogenase family protein [Nocardioides sp.]
MRFELDADQRDFAASLDSLLAASDTVAVARAWAEGDHEPGLELWGRLAELGVTGLATEDTTVEACLAFEALGRHAVPGPWVESAAVLPLALGRDLSGTIATVAVPPRVPYALDADVAAEVFVLHDGRLHTATVGDRVGSVDRSRHLFRVTPGEPVGTLELRGGLGLGVLATSAQLLGAGERLLSDSVAYVKQRRQFGREIGSFQAVKHRLADVRIALDFARPLLHGAAVTTERKYVSAAKVACSDAAYLAARTALQVHGAIGYTAELDLSLWLTKVRALRNAWGSPPFHRAAVLEALGAG